MSYKSKRTILSQKYRMTREVRGYLRDFRHHEGESKYLVGEWQDLSSPRVTLERKKIIQKFPNVVIDVHNYNGIDQGQNGACSLVSILNAFELHGHTKHFFRKPYSQIKKSWRKYWKPPMHVGALDASSDLGEALDMISKPLIKSHDGLVYTPLRSEDRREQCFNEEFWINDREKLVNRYNIPQGEYDKMKHVYEIAYYIENQIDNGIPVVVNVNEHCRVAVGYNQSKLLFADSWSKNYTQRNKSGSSVNMAGFSVDCKWMVYCWARDLISFTTTSKNYYKKNYGSETSSSSSSSSTSSTKRSVASTNFVDLSTDEDSENERRSKKKRMLEKNDDQNINHDNGVVRNIKDGGKSWNSSPNLLVDLTSDDDEFSLSLTERLNKKRKKKKFKKPKMPHQNFI